MTMHQKLDNVGIASTSQEGHGAACTERVGTDVSRLDTCGGFEDSCVPTQSGGDLCSFDRNAYIVKNVVTC